MIRLDDLDLENYSKLVSKCLLVSELNYGT